METFEVKTLGCKVNQYESQALRERMLSLGFKENKNSSLVDVYIVNTCAVTRRADTLSEEEIRKLYRLNPQARIFVTGCFAQKDSERLRGLSGVAAVLGNKDKDSLADFILAHNNNRLDLSLNEGEGGHAISNFHKHTRAFLKVQDGCDNGCSYCIIPRLRGSSRSRPLERIRDEAAGLAENGYKEIVLCGICLGAYGKDLGLKDGLLKVIEALEGLEGIFRIRLSSIEALDVSDCLIEKMASSDKLMPHLHIPFQSADDKILKLMNRKATSDDCRRLVLKLRKLVPDIGLTTDIILGFPQEENNNFKNTLDFLRETRPSKTHIFPFSPRKNTVAWRLPQRLRPEIVRDRVKQARELTEGLARDFRLRHIGKSLEVLVESRGSSADDGFLPGHSGNYIKVFIPEGRGVSVNAIVNVRPLKIHKDGLIAQKNSL